MDKRNEHIEKLTPELIQAFHSGTLTSAKMHQVEILMLESPLYNEGMEGLESLSPEELSVDMDSLTAKVDQATDDEKVGFWTGWKKVAAVILVLITVSGLFYLNQPTALPTKELSEVKKTPEKEPFDSAANKGTKPPQDDLEIKVEDPSPSENQTTALSKPATSSKESEDASITEKKKDDSPADQELILKPILLSTSPAPKSLAFAKPSIDRKSDSLLNQSIKSKIEDRAERARSVVENQSAKRKIESNPLMSSFVQTSQADDLATISVKGIVVGSDDGLPLPQVTVLEKATINGKSTNVDGEFNFDSLKPNTTLVFRYLGYVTQEVKVGTKRELSVKMVPDASSLGEVIVTGVAAATPEKKLPFTTTTIEDGAIDGSRAKTNIGTTQSSTKAKPVDGFPKFRRYLKKNVRYSEFAKIQKIRGQVTVEFRVNSSGELFDFRIIKGLGSRYNEEAVRLIKEGPKWNPKTVGADKTPVLSIVTVKVKIRP